VEDKETTHITAISSPLPEAFSTPVPATPDIQFFSKQHYFGQIVPDRAFKHRFHFRNVGTAPLRIISANCKSSDLKLSYPKVVESQNSGTIDVTFTPRAEGGEVAHNIGSFHIENHNIIIDTNDPNESQIRLCICADVMYRCVPKQIRFTVKGGVDDSTTVRHIRIYDPRHDLRIEHLRSSDAVLSVRLLDSAETNVLDYKNIEVKVNRGLLPASGEIQCAVTFDMTGSDAFMCSKKVPVFVKVIDDLLLQPSVFYFGLMDKNSEPPTAEIMLTHRQEFEITNITIHPPQLNLSVMKTETRKSVRLIARPKVKLVKGKSIAGNVNLNMKIGGTERVVKVPYFGLVEK